MAREFLQIVKESALGTVMGTPVAGTDSIYIRLTEAQSFQMDTALEVETIPWGGGLSTPGELVSDHYSCRGSLSTLLYPSQAKFLLDWAITKVNQTPTPKLPWVTSEPNGDLASCSVYHAIMYADGTFERKRFAGTKVARGRVEVNRQGTTARLSLDLVAARSYGNQMDASTDPDATEFPAPAESAYPSGPYTFKNTAGLLKVGSTRTQYESLSIDWTNTLDGRWFETSYLTMLPFLGRSATLEAQLLLKVSPNDRTAYEALTAQDSEVSFTNGVTTTKIDFNGQNKIMSLPPNLPQNQVFMRTLRLQNLFDPTIGSGAGADITHSTTP